jgi:hypothetical protein
LFGGSFGGNDGMMPCVSCVLDAVCTITGIGIPTDTAFSRNKGRARQEDRTVEVFPVGKNFWSRPSGSRS